MPDATTTSSEAAGWACGPPVWLAGVLPGHSVSMPPDPLSPMLASAGVLPTGVAWVWEWKWDGQRAVTVINGLDRSVKLFSRNGNDITASFPEVVSTLTDSAAGRAMIVDGELTTLSTAGRPDFGLLQRRMHVKRPSAALLRSTPVTYFVFDVLEVEGRSVRTLPYTERSCSKAWVWRTVAGCRYRRT